MFNSNQWRKNDRYQVLILLFLSLFITGGCSAIHGFFGPGSNGGEGTTLPVDANDLATFIQSVRPVHSQVNNHYRLGRYFQKQGRHGIAVDEFLKYLAFDSGSAKAFNALGVSYDFLGNYPLAMAAYNEALVLKPDAPHILNNIGYSYYLSDNAAAAIDVFKRALVLSPGNTKFQNNLKRAITWQEIPQQMKVSNNASMPPDKAPLKEVSMTPDKAPLKEASIFPEDTDTLDNATVSMLFREDKNQAVRESEQINLPENKNWAVKESEQINLSENKNRTVKESEQINLPANPAGNNFGYALQLGAFSTMERAQNLVMAVEKKGLASLFITRVQRDKTYYRVRLGRFETLSDATTAKKQTDAMWGSNSFAVFQSSSTDIVYTSKKGEPLKKKGEHLKALAQVKKNTQFTIEVLNGNGIRRMARDVGCCMQARGKYHLILPTVIL